MDAFFSTAEMSHVFSAENHVRQMLAFEAGLARAQARAGIIAEDIATAIGAACQADAFDIPGLYREVALAGTLAIPLVKHLTARVASEARSYVHWGATSQDAIDTALVLQTREGFDLLERELLAIGNHCAGLADRHRATLMAGRTLMQQAVPITFGLKAARWLGLITRQIQRLRELRPRVLVVQFGGAAGTLAALGAHGPRVGDLLAADLDLGVPDLPWHAERDRIGETAAALGVLAGSLAKIATDLLLLRQTEVGEIGEAAVEGKGGSSAMPHKRNPVDATLALAAARLAIGGVPVILNAMAQEHERGAGGWQTEWEALPALFRQTAAAADRTRAALAGLTVDPDRMRANLESTRGATMAESLTAALTPRIGKAEATRVVVGLLDERASRGGDLRTVAHDAEAVREALSPQEIDRALDPAAYLGASDASIDRALDGFARLS